MEDAKIYECKYCGKQFEKRHQLIGHYSKCKLNPNKKTASEMFLCKYCGKKCVSKQGLSTHQNHCVQNPNRATYTDKENTGLSLNDFRCSFCDKLCKNDNSLRNHERLCKNNPHRQFTWIQEHINEIIPWNKGLTVNTDSRVRANRDSLVQTGYRLADEGNPIFGLKKGKRGLYKGIRCDSRWELAFVIYCMDNGIEIKRYNKYFNYVTPDGINHRYYPDFIINDSIIIEIKGYYDKLSEIKHKQTHEQVVLLRKNQLQEVFDYVTETYCIPLNKIECLYDVRF